MNPTTGDIHEGTPDELLAIERAARERGLREPFIPLTDRQVTTMKAKTPQQRVAIAKRVVKNRNKNRAARKSRRRARR